MSNVNRKCVKCEKCGTRIPNNRPVLKCSLCDCIKHFKCNGLTRNEAFDIIENHSHWTCLDCLQNILPINLVLNVRNECQKCDACSKLIKSSTAISKCEWCGSRCHKTCTNGQLGCNKCCSTLIPGYKYFAHDLLGETYLENRPLFNPFDQEHIINQLGLHKDTLHEQATLNDFSDTLLNCEYSRLKSLPPSCNGNPRILSLNIRSLFKGIEKLKDDIIVLQQKCDILCLSETNLKLESLPHGLDDIYLDGFHKPVYKNPYRSSGKGGGLVIYINKSFCDSDDIVPLFIDDAEDLNKEPEANPPGEFLFVKLGYKIQDVSNTQKITYKYLIVGNVYRSPSSSSTKFISHLDWYLRKLDRHKNKSIHIVGDFNIDLAQYDSDFHCHDLINKMAEHNFAQVISLPTRITDHSATIIDHIYSNEVHNIVKTRVVTMDISDHLGTYIQFAASHGSLSQNASNKDNP